MPGLFHHSQRNSNHDMFAAFEVSGEKHEEQATVALENQDTPPITSIKWKNKILMGMTVCVVAAASFVGGMHAVRSESNGLTVSEQGVPLLRTLTIDEQLAEIVARDPELASNPSIYDASKLEQALKVFQETGQATMGIPIPFLKVLSGAMPETDVPEEEVAAHRKEGETEPPPPTRRRLREQQEQQLRMYSKLFEAAELSNESREKARTGPMPVAESSTFQSRQLQATTRMTVKLTGAPSWAKQVKFTGNQDRLANWNPCNGVAASWNGEAWEAQIDLYQGEVQLKGVAFPNSDNCQGLVWEPEGNKIFTVRGFQETVVDQWGEDDTVHLLNRGFQYIKNKIDNMRHIIRYKTDFFGLEFDEGRNVCWILAKETDEEADWANNNKFGTTNVYNVEPNFSGNYGVAIRAYTGLAEPYNGLRIDLWNTIKYQCIMKSNRPGLKFNFAGFSRGGGLVAIAAAALQLEGRLPAEDVRLFTVGSMRALASRDAQRVHGNFEQWRLAYRGDGVPSQPPGWGGWAHYGWNVALQAGYTAGQNAPSGSWTNFQDHDSYHNWLPVWYWNTTPQHSNY